MHLFFQDKISNHLQLVMLENHSHCSEPHKIRSSYNVSSGTSKIGFENADGSELAKVSVRGEKTSENSSQELLASIRCKKWGLMKNGSAPTAVHIHARAFVLL